MKHKTFLAQKIWQPIVKVPYRKRLSLGIIALAATFALASLTSPGCGGGGGSGGSAASSQASASSLVAYDNENLHETVLSPANVNQARFGKLFSDSVDGWITAQPLYVPGVTIGGRRHNVIYVATEHDSVYAFNAGRPGPPLWHKSFIDPAAGVDTVTEGDLNGPILCPDLPEMGIVGTPVIDRKTGTLYVVSVTIENGTIVHRLHALSITNGSEKFGGPVVIRANVAGIGAGSTAGRVSFNDSRQLQRPALLLHNGVLYIGFGSHCDFPPYHGWLLAYDPRTLQQLYAFNTTPDGWGGGVWMSGDLPATDASGDLYISTGNGAFDADTGGSDYGDSIIRLHPSSSGLSVVDYFAPSNQQYLSEYDLDLGSGGIMLIPGNRLVTGGKDGTLFFCDLDDLGGFNPTSNHVLQEFNGVFGALFGTSAYWNGDAYVIGSYDPPEAFAVSSGTSSQTPVSQASVSFVSGAAIPAISANGNSNGILWVVSHDPAVLYAFDAKDLSNELYDSGQAGTRDTLGMGAPFMVPTVAHAKVYVGTETALNVFGLLK